MKTTQILCALLLMAASLGAHAAIPYYYDPARASGASWHGANAWSTNSFDGPFDQNWVDGNVAYFNFSAIKIVSLADTDTHVGGLVNSNQRVWISSSNPANLTFAEGGEISSTADGYQVRGAAVLVGPVTLKSGVIDWVAGELRGPLTVQGGSVLAAPSALTTNSHFNVAGGNVTLQSGDLYLDIGDIHVTSADFAVGRYNGDPVAATISSLSGTGGQVMPRLTINDGVVNSLTVDQSTNTTYSGTVAGVQLFSGNYGYLDFTKSGSGDLTLAGTVNLRQGTTVDGGRLYLNGATAKNFHNLDGGADSAAILVANGGALGGTATLNILGGRHVVVEAGGGLVAGVAGAAGRTTYAFEAGQGGKLDLTDAAGGGNGRLRFDLGSDATAGTTYDQIRVTGGTLEIGTGQLNLSDFAFNALEDIDAGTYVLVDAPTINGTLGEPLSGRVVPSYSGTLRLENNQILLDVAFAGGTTILVR